MAKLNIKVENGTTVVTIDGEVVTGMAFFKANCEGNNRGDDAIEFSYGGRIQGVVVQQITVAEGEIVLTLPDALGQLLKGA